MAKKRDRKTIGSTTPEQAEDGPTAVYRAMLAEVGSSPAEVGEEGKAVKKRRVKGRIIEQRPQASTKDDSNPPIEGVSRSLQTTKANFGTDISSMEDQMAVAQQQTAYNDETEEFSEDEMNWEEVDLSHELDEGKLDLLSGNQEGQEHAQAENLNLVLHDNGDQNMGKITMRRKPVSSAEKEKRLEIHKMHITCLLSHLHLRNHWCNDEDIQKVLFRRLPKKTVSNLNPEESHSQFRKDQTFKQGLKEANQIFRNAFTKTARGIRRPYWAEDPNALPEPPSDSELPMQKRDFLVAAKTLEGSRDVGAQLFCALLRAAAVETRLICSLQPLPFSAVAKGNRMGPTPRPIPVIDHTAQLSSSPDRDTSSSKPSTRASTPATTHSRSIIPPHPPPPRPKMIIESPFPVYWTEAFNPFAQKWIPIDPLVTKELFKPSKLTPPLSDPFNTLSYVIAFEDDLSAHDVTRRYTTAYNAKVRKQRVESTKDGALWLVRVIRMFTPRTGTRSRPEVRDREQIEAEELARREAAEAMPKNVVDFKDHPVYALERHLKRNEVVWPKREVGRVAAGRAAGGGAARREGAPALSEPIYRRSDVQVCRSADNWYRVGRKIKAGEQALKHVASRHKAREASFHDPEEAEDAERKEQEGLGLYALHQTEVYIPPSIPQKGYPIPKNPYGNLDVYVPSMVPERGVHIRHPWAALAAKILGIDYADAVTGFSFKGRHGTAVVAGAVVWEGHKEGVENVIEGLEDEDERDKEDKRTKVALGYWKRWLQMLRIRERVEGYAGEESGNNNHNAPTDDIDDRMEEDSKNEDEEGGGFFHEKEIEEIAQPTTRRFYGGGYGAGEEDQGGGFLAEDYEETEYPIQGRAEKMVQNDDEKELYALVNEDAEDPVREVEKQGEQETLDTYSRYSEPVPQEILTTPIESYEEQIPDFTIERDQYSRVEYSGQDVPTTSRESHGDQKVRRTNFLSIATNDRTEDHYPRSSQAEGKSYEDVSLHPCLTEEDYEEARIVQELHERGELPPSLNRMPVGVSTPAEKLEGNKSPEAEEIVAADRSSRLQRRDSEDEERGSLMSEDPSDEDKDPEWLL